MSATVLVIEDDRFLSDSLSRLLGAQGYIVQQAANGSEGLSMASRKCPDLVVLDLGLPDRDGLDVCRELRGHTDLPILMLTSRSESIDKVLGFEVGADDYLTKPFDPHELIARIKALLRRHRRGAEKAGTASKITVGSVVIDSAARTVWCDGTALELTDMEFRIMEYLGTNRGRAISREQLFEAVWGFEIEFSSNSLEVLIYRIRQKLHQAHAEPIVQTIRGYGYKIDI
jgi:DNA-binding response OmpR family regulator